MNGTHPYNLKLENAIMDQRGKFQVLRTTSEIPDFQDAYEPCSQYISAI